MASEANNGGSTPSAPAKTAQQRYYAKNRQKYLDYAKYWKRVRKMIIVAFKDRPCEDCGVWYPPCVMDFDHVRGIKKFNIGAGNNRASINGLLDEIVKCDVVCANCHRLRTASRGGATEA